MIEIPLSKQWRPGSDAASCGVWSRSALFAYVPQKGRHAYMGSTVLRINKSVLLKQYMMKETTGHLKINKRKKTYLLRVSIDAVIKHKCIVF